MAWSGDIFQANASGADLEFVVPKEGAAIWTDNMCIPVHAQHPRDAMTYMDFVYNPKIAGADHRLRQLHHPGAGDPGDLQEGGRAGHGRRQGRTTRDSRPAR